MNLGYMWLPNYHFFALFSGQEVQ